MKRTATIGILLAALIFLLSGCEGLNIFEFNLFEEMQVINAGTQITSIVDDTEKTNTEKIEEIEDLVDSDTFFETLLDEENSETLDAITTYLDSVVDGEADSPEEQQALLLEAKIEIITSGGDEIVSGLADLAATMLGGEGEDTPEMNPVTILSAIIPEDTTEEEFSDMITGLFTANETYEELGSALTGDTTLYDGVNEGEMAQNAIVANVVANCICDLAETSEPNDTQIETAIVELFDFLQEVQEAEDPATVVSPFSTEFDPFEDITNQDSHIYNLVAGTELAAMLESLMNESEE